MSLLTFSMKATYLILPNFIWSSHQIELETQLEAVLPLCWWRRFAVYITGSEGWKKERRKGRSEGRSLGHHGKMRAPQLERWEGSWEMGKGQEIILSRGCKAAHFGNSILFTKHCFEWGSAWYKHSGDPSSLWQAVVLNVLKRLSREGYEYVSLLHWNL